MNHPPRHTPPLRCKKEDQICPTETQEQKRQHLETMSGVEVQLKCIASMEVQRHTQLGFMCGSLPVPASYSPLAASNSLLLHQNPDTAVVPSLSLQTQRSLAPQYWLLPLETDLNTLPTIGLKSEELMPITSILDPADIYDQWSMSYISRSLAWKSDTLAVHAISGYGDEIDIVAPVEILKQIFKTPYSKARLSVAVHRIGRTLVLNSGPDTEEAEKLASRKKTQAKLERSLFSNFVQHSLHVPHDRHMPPPGACSRSQSSTCSGSTETFSQESFGINSHYAPVAQHQHTSWKVVDNDVYDGQNGSTSGTTYATPRVPSTQNAKQRYSWSCAPPSRCRTGNESLQKSRLFGKQQHDTDCAHQDAEDQHSPSSEGFLRVVFWQFHNLRMLLGSDLLIFSNDKHVAVSLHLVELEGQVTPLMWLDAWLDNVMASVPELAICYHRKGVVQGYELLKTDDIFLVKGLAEDGTALFQPHVVQQNAMSVLRFLKENCTRDPGTYWLFKNAGEDLLQIFDLTVMSKSCSSCVDKEEKWQKTLPSLKNSSRGYYILPLAMLLYRIAQRLSRSKDPKCRRKCAKLFQKCLEFFDEEEHLIMRASAHEQVARLLLNSCEEQEPIMIPLLLEFMKTELVSSSVPKEPQDGIMTLPSNSVRDVDGNCNRRVTDDVVDSQNVIVPNLEESYSTEGTESLSFPNSSVTANSKELVQSIDYKPNCSSGDFKNLDYPDISTDKNEVAVYTDVSHVAGGMQVVTDSVSSRLAAVHHVSQAIISLRSQRQLHDTGDGESKHTKQESNHPNRFPLCLCGEIECFTFCDFRENEVGSKMDQKLRKLVLLLGESYLALGHAYKEESQLGRALQAAELAFNVYGSMGQEEAVQLIVGTTEGGNGCSLPPSKCFPAMENLTGVHSTGHSHSKFRDKNTAAKTGKHPEESEGDSSLHFKGHFWGKLLTLIGDIYVGRSRLHFEQNSQPREVSRCKELKISKEVAKEVRRLKKKITNKRSCVLCTLTDCSCQTDRVNSGSSASSSSSSTADISKHARRSKGSRTRSPNLALGLDLTAKTSISLRADEKPQKCDLYCNLSSAKNPGLSTTAMQNNPQRSNIEQEKQEIIPPKDAFWFLKGPLNSNPEINLSIAIECYESAVVAIGALVSGADDLVSALRKKGWACNELGRRRLAHGETQLAEETFDIAIQAFRRVGDFKNIVLVNCNLGHSRRASAEALLSEFSNCAENTAYHGAYVERACKVKSLYGEALKFYSASKQELKASSVLNQPNDDLHNQVVTQLAHTYLRLGMFLAREQQLSCSLGHKENSSECAIKGGAGDKKTSEPMLAITAGDAIREALLLYESLGDVRAQEAAFAHFQLACYQRDWFKRTASKGNEHFGERGGTGFHHLKRYASLADRHWQKALEFYKADTHPDMFLEILMERSALNLGLTPPSMPSQVTDLSLSYLLEGRLAFQISKSSSHDGEAKTQDALPQPPSSKVAAEYYKQLQALLKRMLASAISASKTSCNSSSHLKKCTESHFGDSNKQKRDLVKLKDMYGLSLKLCDRSSIEALYTLWSST